MNREQFRNILSNHPSQDQPSFLEYFCCCLTQMDAAYTSRYNRIPQQLRAFAAVGVENALQSYTWPAKVTYLSPHRVTLDIIYFQESFDALSHFRDGLQQSIRNNTDVTEWSAEILKWGMGSRGYAALEFINQLGNANDYLKLIDQISNLDGDTDQVQSQVVQEYNSGLSKIHSLASSSGLIIYDSRVAFAIGECVSEWAMSTNQTSIPASLKFMQAGRRVWHSNDKKTIPPRGHNAGYKHPTEHRDYRWLETQMRASWLFEAALEQEIELWPDDDIFVRMHKLEAAFFMFGAYACALTLPAV